MLCAFLWSGCQTAPGTRASDIAPTVTPPITIEPMSSLTSSDSLILTSTPIASPGLPPTPIGLQSPNKNLLLEYNPLGAEAKSDIWLLPPPYQKAQPFRTHDVDYAYCCPVWSPNGQWMAYVRTSVTQPISSLWISQLDQNLAHQIGDEMQRILVRPGAQTTPGIQTIVPVGWSRDGKNVIVVKGDEEKIYAVNVETGKKTALDFLPSLASLGVQPIANPSHFVQFNSKTDQFLLYGDTKQDGRLVFLITRLGQLDHMALLTPPEDYSSVGQGGLPFVQSEVSLSPDGRFLLVADYERHQVQERLWRVDLELKKWDVVFSQPANYLPNSVSWSPDQQWIAWWSQWDTGIAVFFIDTLSWKLTREYVVLDTRPGSKAIGWTTDAQGKAGFAILENRPGRGIIVLKSDGSEADDWLLIDADQLIQQLPFNVYERWATEWMWQP